jgi:hypothetical protein
MEPAEQVRASRVEQVVVVEVVLERCEQRESTLGTVGHRDRDRAVELDHRRGRGLGEPVVQRGDLRPVGVLGPGRSRVERGDRALQLVRTRSSGEEGPVQGGETLVDHRVVPAGTILVLEQDHRPPWVRPGVPARMLQEHQREQAPDLGLVGHQHQDDAGQTDRLVAQIRPDQGARGGGVPLVEHEVHDGEHAREPLGQELGRRDPVGDRRLTDLALGPDEALGHRGFGHQERPRDLAGREAAEGLQRQRDPRVHLQGRVAAREDQPQPVVRDRAHVLLVTSERLERLDRAELRRLLSERPFAPEPVDRAVARGRGDPRAGVVGDPALGPHTYRLRERVLDRVLGEVEVA